MKIHIFNALQNMGKEDRMNKLFTPIYILKLNSFN